MIRNYENLKSYTTKDKSEIIEIFHPNNSEIKNQSLALAVVAPQKRTKLHHHKNSEEVYFVLEGDGIIYLDGKEFKAEKNNAVLIKTGLKHNIKNTGSKELKFLCISSPAYNHDDTLLD